MRIVIFLSFIVLAISGCASSGMYSVPTQNRIPIQSQIQVYSQPVAYNHTTVENRQVKQSNSPAKKNQPNPSKKSGKNKAYLNDAMGVPVRFAKNAIRYLKPKLSKLTGF